MTEKLIQSYVEEEYFVSTVYRESSTSAETPIWYYETIVWKWNKETKTRGKMVDMEDSGFSPLMAIINHCEICKELITKGGV